jgi:diamine N-acetyltransferase
MVDLGGRELHGEHVVLRPLRLEDAALTLRWRLSDRAKFLNRGAKTVAEQAAWIAARPRGELNFVIELRTGKPVGLLSLVSIDEAHRRAEPARFLIGEPEAVRGIPAAAEAMALLYRLVFDEMKLERVHGVVAADNRFMIKWQKYLGMKEEGRLRRHLLFDGRYHDAICLGMLEQEYRNIALPRLNALIAAATPNVPGEGRAKETRG